MPVRVENYNGRIDDSELLLHALTFTDSAHLVSRMLGTGYNKTFKFRLVGDILEITDEDGSWTVDIISLNRDNLKLQYDSFNIVTYIPFPDQEYKDQAKLIYNKLSNESWYLDDPNFTVDDRPLIEFKDSLEDRIVRHYLRKQLNAAGIHIFKQGYSYYHMRAIWGINYFNNNNVLSISELDGSSLNNVIFVTEVSDSLISGYKFINKKRSPVTFLKANVGTKNVKRLLSRKWKLSAFEEVQDEYGIVEDSFNDVEKTLKLSDLKENRIIFNLTEDNLFTINVDNDTLTHGSWRLSNSGRLVELTSKYYDNGHTLIRNHFLSIIELDSSHLQIYRRENIKSGENESEKLQFIETYEPVCCL